MNIPTKSLKTGFSLPVYGLGTWQMGGRWEADTSNDEAEIKAIKYAIANGISHLDTAESYGNGHAEELIAKATEGFNRSKLFIASKVSGDHQTYDQLHQAFEQSLKRLKTDYIDLYLLHRFPEPGTDIADTMRALDELVDSGKVKYIGVCNFSINRLKEAQKHTQHKIVCNQVHYSLECREIVERGVLQYCQDNDILVVAWGPLSKGTLDKAAILHTFAIKYNKTPYQVALNWLISQPNVVTIPKTTQAEHLDENLGSLGWDLDDQDMKELTDNFPNQILVSDRVPLDYDADVEV